MSHHGKCPKCEATVSSLKFEVVEIAERDQSVASGGVFLCPNCNTILGVGLHPEAMISDLVERLKT